MAAQSAKRRQPRTDTRPKRRDIETRSSGRSESRDSETSRLRARYGQGPSGSLIWYWELGRDAGRFLSNAKSNHEDTPNTRELAEAIGGGLRDATLRQALKFSGRVNKGAAKALDKAGVPWRGMVLALGVKRDDQFAELLKQMQDGLTNSTKIRDYIDANFKKPAEPRFVSDLTGAVTKWQQAADDFAAIYARFNEDFARHIDSNAPKEFRAARKQLRKLADQLKEVERVARASKKAIEGALEGLA